MRGHEAKKVPQTPVCHETKANQAVKPRTVGVGKGKELEEAVPALRAGEFHCSISKWQKVTSSPKSGF